MADLGRKTIKNLNNHEHTMPGFLPVGSREMEIERRGSGLEKDVSQNGPISSEVVPPERVISRTISSNSPKGQVSVLCPTSLSLLEPPKTYTDTESDVFLKKGKKGEKRSRKKSVRSCRSEKSTASEDSRRIFGAGWELLFAGRDGEGSRYKVNRFWEKETSADRR